MKRYRITGEGSLAEELPLDAAGGTSADISFDEQGNACVERWGRSAESARIPAEIEGKKVTKIAPLAFAAFHLPEDAWDGFKTGISMSFSIFCMMNAGKMNREDRDDGGAVHIYLPETVEEIGQYAFWHCDRLESVELGSKVKSLKEGVFGSCSRLKEVFLPKQLEEIGGFYPDTVHAMPDVGCFSGCHALEKLVLPLSLKQIGAQAFNSCGLRELIVEDTGETWSRKIRIDTTAFDHTASLQWMGRRVDGQIVWQIGLPVSREKILTCDKKYNVISRLPRLFFESTPQQMDAIAKDCFRLDFSGRMAIARLCYPKYLEEEADRWYEDVIIDYFDRLDQFWPESENKEEEAFDLLCTSPHFTAESLGRLMYLAGKAHVRTELLFKMQKVRNTRFSNITGFEDLEL